MKLLRKTVSFSPSWVWTSSGQWDVWNNPFLYVFLRFSSLLIMGLIFCELHTAISVVFSTGTLCWTTIKLHLVCRSCDFSVTLVALQSSSIWVVRCYFMIKDSCSRLAMLKKGEKKRNKTQFSERKRGGVTCMVHTVFWGFMCGCLVCEVLTQLRRIESSLWNCCYLQQ